MTTPRPRKWPALTRPSRDLDSMYEALVKVVEALQIYQAERGEDRSAQFSTRQEREDLEENTVGFPWAVDRVYGDLVLQLAASLFPTGLPGVGTDRPSASPAFFAAGDTRGLAGYTGAVEKSLGGGFAVIGFSDNVARLQLPEPDAPVVVGGSSVRILGPTLLEVDTDLTEDHYLIIKDSFDHPDGNKYALVDIGPRVVYALPPEEDFDSGDYDVTDVTVPLAINLVLQNDYNNPADTRYEIGVWLEELRGRAGTFTVDVKVNGSTALLRSDITRNGSGDFYTESDVLLNPLSAGDTITMEVSAVSSHPQTDAWVLGSTRAAYVRVKQG